ncbi:transcription factor bHLH104-like protein [Tanacetum coccineum]
MARPLFNWIVEEVASHSSFFRDNIDCTGREGISPLLKPKYLRKPTVTDVVKLYRHHEEKKSFLRMLGSLDCTDWEWFRSPYAFKAQYVRRNHGPNPFNLLEAVIPFVAKGVTYPWGYHLVDRIYPELATLVKTIPEPADDDYKRIRGRSNSCSRAENKACRERQRREKLNESSTLEPYRPATTDKLAILGHAIRVLNQLKSESQECKEMNEKLLEEIKTLKAEKIELREEKIALKSEKAKVEQQVKAMTNNNLPPPGFMAPHPDAYQAGANKMPVFPGYSYIPMWQYLPQATCDTSHDHELRPPAA